MTVIVISLGPVSTVALTVPIVVTFSSTTNVDEDLNTGFVTSTPFSSNVFVPVPIPVPVPVPVPSSSSTPPTSLT